MLQENGRYPRWFTGIATLICIDGENGCVYVVTFLEKERMEATIVSYLIG